MHFRLVNPVLLPCGTPFTSATDTSVSTHRSQSAGSSHRDHVGASGSSSAEVAMAGKAQESCVCRSAECIVKSCNCFAGNRICTRRCRCRCCKNFQGSQERQAAFGKEVGATALKKCRCIRSGCIVRQYCGCFDAGLTCSDKCTCKGCNNMEGHPDRKATLDREAREAATAQRFLALIQQRQSVNAIASSAELESKEREGDKRVS